MDEKELKRLTKEQRRELELTKHTDKIYPEVITPKKIPQPLNKKRLAFLLRYAGYTEKNIAQLLSLSVGTIIRYLKRRYNKPK